MAKPVPSYQLKITLIDTAPPVWRRVIVPGGWHLGRVHAVVQGAMGWQFAHLHAFERDGQRWGEPSGWDDGSVHREQVARLAEVVPNVGDELIYTYDFGDGWAHALLVEQIVVPTQRGATCTGGGGACPPEDCGGPWGYRHLLEVAADPAHPEHTERLEWLGGPWDAEAFDLSLTDAAVRRLG